MKVDGAIFMSARKKIRARSPKRGGPGQPAKGTQEWLADQAKVSIRAVQYLERGEAGLKTIQAISSVLEISNWEEYIQDYGAEYVTCTASRHIDFRPEQHPGGYPENFMYSVVLMTLDPISIFAESGKFNFYLLKEISAELVGLDQSIHFTWLAEVSLTPSMNTWLGWVREVDEIRIEANDTSFNIPIMFSQLNTPYISWAEFVEMTENSQNSHFNVEFKLKFSRFEKIFSVYVPIDFLKVLFEQGRQKYQSAWPHRTQLKAVV